MSVRKVTYIYRSACVVWSSDRVNVVQDWLIIPHAKRNTFFNQPSTHESRCTRKQVKRGKLKAKNIIIVYLPGMFVYLFCKALAGRAVHALFYNSDAHRQGERGLEFAGQTGSAERRPTAP